MIRYQHIIWRVIHIKHLVISWRLFVFYLKASGIDAFFIAYERG